MSTISVKKDMTMKMKVIGYWATTTAIALELLAGGVTDLLHGREVLVVGRPVVEDMVQLGYPVYLLTILGVWKLLGGVALLVPRFPRLKEWAYAGAFFEMTGAAASWALRSPSRILGSLFPARAHV